MVDELTSLLDMFHGFKKAGRSATLTVSTKGGLATKVKLEVELDDAKPSHLSTTSSPASSRSAPSLPGCQAAGVRLRPRGSAARRAKANARAAQHRAFQALPFPGGYYSAALGSPDPPPPQRRPLHVHPSPSGENRRLILTVDRKAGCQPTFAQLDGDGDPPTCTPTSTLSSSTSPTTSPPTSTLTLSQSSPPVTPPRFSRPYPHPPPLLPLPTVNLCGSHQSQRTSAATVGLNVLVYLEGPAEAAQQGRVDVRMSAAGVLALGATSNHRTSIEHSL